MGAACTTHDVIIVRSRTGNAKRFGGLIESHFGVLYTTAKCPLLAISGHAEG